MLDNLPQEIDEEDEEEIIEFVPRFNIKKINDNLFEIEGKEVEKWVAMTDFENDEAVERLQRIFKKMGLEDELKNMGVTPQSKIKVKNIEFTYFND